jgi:hypothetical protein
MVSFGHLSILACKLPRTSWLVACHRIAHQKWVILWLVFIESPRNRQFYENASHGT